MKALTIEEQKQIQLKILAEVDNFCKEKNIKYFLNGGTLIGAIRHKGYIPWDDDIDIMMLRKDYELFVEQYITSKGTNYRLNNHKISKKYYLPYVKIDDPKTILKEGINHESELGVNIDLFPIDDLPGNRDEQRALYKKAQLLIGLINLKQLPFSSSRSIFKNIILLLGRLILALVPLRIIVSKLASLPLHKKYNSDYCGDIVWGYSFREVSFKKEFDTAIYATFEDGTYPVPIGYDSYLKRIYGDYMVLPPEDKRVSTHTTSAYQI